MSTGIDGVVTGEWLAAHLGEVYVLDCRWYADGRRGADAYAGGHIPGAAFVDLDTDLSGPPAEADGRHPLPTPEHFAAALGRLGIAAGSPVVVYDDAQGSIAARLWWMLHVLDEPVAVLEGGIQSWPGELTTDVSAQPQVEREPVAWPLGRFVDADQVALATEDTTIVDARAADRYAGTPHPLDPRPGHVPGAVSRAWQGNLDEAGRFLPAAQLYERFATDRPVIAYCGSGVTACHDLLAMHLAGIERTALYTGSWSQWSADENRPAETDPSD